MRAVSIGLLVLLIACGNASRGKNFFSKVRRGKQQQTRGRSRDRRDRDANQSKRSPSPYSYEEYSPPRAAAVGGQRLQSWGERRPRELVSDEAGQAELYVIGGESEDDMGDHVDERWQADWRRNIWPSSPSCHRGMGKLARGRLGQPEAEVRRQEREQRQVQDILDVQEQRDIEGEIRQEVATEVGELASGFEMETTFRTSKFEQQARRGFNRQEGEDNQPRLHRERMATLPRGRRDTMGRTESQASDGGGQRVKFWHGGAAFGQLSLGTRRLENKSLLSIMKRRFNTLRWRIWPS